MMKVVRPAAAAQAQQPRWRPRRADEGGVVAPEAAGLAGDVGQHFERGRHGGDSVAQRCARGAGTRR